VDIVQPRLALFFRELIEGIQNQAGNEIGGFLLFAEFALVGHISLPSEYIAHFG
jgi:hypothetical protein